MFSIEKANVNDVDLILEIQKECFKEYLEKYNDGPVNPSNETYDHLKMYVEHKDTTVYIMKDDNRGIGIIKVRKLDEETYKLNDFGIIPEFRDRHLGRDAFSLIDKMHGSPKKWVLSTILEEERNIHFYEKFGFVRGDDKDIKVINDKMTIVPYIRVRE